MKAPAPERAPRPIGSTLTPVLTAILAVVLMAATLSGAGTSASAAPTAPTAPTARTAPAAQAAPAAAARADTEPQISAGGQETCRVRPDGQAYCAGDNFAGQVGDGTTVPRQKMQRVGTDADWVDISTSGGNTCAIKTDTTLWCWGQNTRGQLGIGAKPQQWVPQRVGAGFATVSTGWLATCGVKTDGSLWCWGSNKYGTLGIGSFADRLRPARVGTATTWDSVAVGGWHGCALDDDGAASCWGLNDFGQLGIGSTTTQSSPVRVPGRATYRSLDANWSSTCGTTSTGAALCWGINDQGQLGNGTRTAKLKPTKVAGGRSWTQVTTGDGHACGLDTEGKAWCWGNNRYGQLGVGSISPTAVPVRVAGDLTWTSLSVGWMHTCGSNAANQVLCWGNNELGQLSRGNRVQRTTPPGVLAPAQRVARARPDGVMTAMSFNILDSVHTKPGGGALWWAPGRIRMEWAAALVFDYQTDLVGFQELNLNQARYLEPALKRSFDFYPKSNGLWSEVLNTVGWRKAEWKFVEREILRVPVLGRVRSTHIVRLENRQTGKNIWVLNAHNSPGKSAQAQQDRARATTIQINKILEKRKQKFPVIFLGDMNDKESVFCKTTRSTDLRAVSGGRTTKSSCKLPTNVYLDWMFASPELAPKGFRYEGSGRTLRVTDHHVLTAQLTVPGF